jgi:hypothetical protein
MADIFISYARTDRDIAKRLADSLVANGYQVWWDTELVGSDDFRDVIFEELTLAKAVIVVWSENSVRSKFVRDEAGRADHAEKLIATCKPGFDMQTLPLGFGGRHCHRVDELEQTLKALHRLAVVPAQQKPAGEKKLIEEEAAAWERVKTSSNRQDFENYIKTYANGLNRAAAKIYLRKLDFLDNKAVRRAGLFGYRALQVYAWILVFSVIVGLLAAPFAGASGSGQQPPVAIMFAVFAVAGFATYRLHRWFYSRKL